MKPNILMTPQFKQAFKLLKKKHQNNILKDIIKVIEQLVNFEITTQKSNHPLSDGINNLHIRGDVILLYRYQGAGLIIDLNLLNITDHKELQKNLKLAIRDNANIPFNLDMEKRKLKENMDINTLFQQFMQDPEFADAFNEPLEEELIQSSSNKALQQNIKTEIDSGKSPKQAAAIAYNIQRKNENMNESTIQSTVDEIINNMEDNLNYADNKPTDIEFELSTTNSKELKKIFSLLDDMCSDKHIDYGIENEETYPGGKYYYATLSRKYPDDYYFDYESDETTWATQPGQRTGKYKDRKNENMNFMKYPKDSGIDNNEVEQFIKMCRENHFLQMQTKGDFEEIMLNFLQDKNINILARDIHYDGSTSLNVEEIKNIIKRYFFNSDENINLKENTITNTLPPSIDKFLMDMSQMYIDDLNYNDISKFGERATEEDIKQLRKYRRELSQGFEEDDPEVKEIFDKIKNIVKENLNEDTNISIDNMEVNIDKVKNKSVRVDEDHQLEEIPPYDRDQLLIELKDVTRDFTIPNDTIVVGYESEKDYAIDILSENGYECEDSMKGEWFEIYFSKKEKLEEKVSPSSTFIELEGFRKDWKDLGLTDDDLKDLQNLIINYPESATPLGSNVYKIRFSPKSLNKGSSGSDRIIYIEVIKSNLIYLATAFSKGEEENISKETLNNLRTFAKILNK